MWSSRRAQPVVDVSLIHVFVSVWVFDKGQWIQYSFCVNQLKRFVLWKGVFGNYWPPEFGAYFLAVSAPRLGRFASSLGNLVGPIHSLMRLKRRTLQQVLPRNVLYL